MYAIVMHKTNTVIFRRLAEFCKFSGTYGDRIFFGGFSALQKKSADPDCLVVTSDPPSYSTDSASFSVVALSTNAMIDVHGKKNADVMSSLRH